MTLDNLMNMATADRYTEDGRQQIEDARRTYKPGEISEKTGLQKQNDGTWAPPKAGAVAGERKKHDPVTGEGKDFRVVKNGKVLAIKGISPEDVREAFSKVGIKVSLKDIEEVGKKNESAGSSRGKEFDTPDVNGKLIESSSGGYDFIFTNKKNGKVDKLHYNDAVSALEAFHNSKDVHHGVAHNIKNEGSNGAGGKSTGSTAAKASRQKSIKPNGEERDALHSLATVAGVDWKDDVYNFSTFPREDLEKLAETVTPEMVNKMDGKESYAMKKFFNANGMSTKAWSSNNSGSTATKEPDLSKVGHYNLNVARNDMNTTRAEDKWLDNFVTEMHEDGTSLDEIIKRQDEVFAKSKGRYPEEEKTYKSLREKIMKHYGGTSNADKAEIEKIKSGITGSTAAGNDKWAPAKDYLNREFLKMKTPSGGYVSIYETSNENQKNNRFRVDTGTHYNLFNTLEEAKAFAEYNYGETGDAACDEQLYTPESINGPREKLERQLTGDTRIRVKK